MPSSVKSSPDGPLSPKFFPQTYGRLVALLARRLGGHNLDGIEDAVQTAMVRALESWTRGGPPNKPEAWLYRVAHNGYLEGRRREGRQRTLLKREFREDEQVEQPTLVDADDAMVHAARVLP